MTYKKEKGNAFESCIAHHVFPVFCIHKKARKSRFSRHSQTNIEATAPIISKDSGVAQVPKAGEDATPYLLADGPNSVTTL